MNVVLDNQEFFHRKGKIMFEDHASNNPLTLRCYDENKVVAVKTMKDHLRFAVCYWHTFCGTGADPFGSGTKTFQRDASSDYMQAAKDKMDATFDFITKLGVPYYCFQDVDLISEGASVAEDEKGLQTMVDYARKNCFKGCFYIEPKPMEPTKHQYYYDAATVINFLPYYGLDKDFKLNDKADYATLAGHTFEHELQVAADGMLGSIDANCSDMQNGWDADQFSINLYERTKAMLVILQEDNLITTSLNLDAKTPRNSTDLEDIFIAHIAEMDTFTRVLTIAVNVLKNSQYKKCSRNVTHGSTAAKAPNWTKLL